MTGREAMGTAEIRRALAEANAAYDGPGGVALYWTDAGAGERLAALDYADDDPEGAVVEIPGDGRPYPERAFVEALACSQVRERP
jgi:hypothetical protein